MAKVSRESAIEYDGVQYVFTPSNRLLRRIDAGLAPQTHMSVLAQLQSAAEEAKSDTMAGAKVPFSALAYIMSEMISEGGGDVSEDDVYGEIMDDMTNNGGKGLPGLIEAVIETVSPPERVVKNSPSPAKAGGKKKPARK